MHFEKIILPYIAMATGIFRWLDFMVLVSCFMAFVFHFVVFRYILWISLRFVLCHRKGILLQMARHSFLVVFGFLQGPNNTYSGDGHDKLMDFMNNTFPLAVYGLQDVFSGYILYLKLWPSNSDPKLIARWYLEYLYESRGNCSWFDSCYHRRG